MVIDGGRGFYQNGFRVESQKTSYWDKNICGFIFRYCFTISRMGLPFIGFPRQKDMQELAQHIDLPVSHPLRPFSRPGKLCKQLIVR